MSQSNTTHNHFDPARAAIAVLADIERLNAQVADLAERLKLSQAAVEHHKLELIRIRRELNARHRAA